MRFTIRRLLPLFLLFLFPLPLWAEGKDKGELADLKKALASLPHSKIAIEYSYSPPFHRHEKLVVLSDHTGARFDSFWKGPRGDRHDALILNPQEGIYQGEYYRDSYSLLFWDSYPGGRNQLLSSLDDAETFGGACLLWYLKPLEMLNLFNEKEVEVTASGWKARWGKKFTLEIEWEKGSFALKKFLLSDSSKGAKTLCEVVKYQKIGSYPKVPVEIRLTLVDSEKKETKSTLQVKKVLPPTFNIYEISPHKNSHMTVVDLNLLTVSQYEAALKKDPENPRLWFSFGKAQVYNRNGGMAEKAYRKALSLKPQAGMIHHNLIVLSLQRQAYGTTWQYLFDAQSSGIRGVDKLYFTAARYCRNNSQQRKFLAQGILRNSYNYWALDLYSKLERPDKVLQYIFRAVYRFPTEEKYQLLLEKVLLKIDWERIYPGIRERSVQSLKDLQKKYPQQKNYARILKKIPSF